MARWFQYQAKTEPVTVPAAVVAVSFIACEVFFPRSIIYQAKAEPIVISENITVDKWFNPLSEPVRVKRFQTSEQQSLAFQFPYPTAPTGAVSTYLEGPPSSVRLLQYQSVAFPVPFTAEYVWAPLVEGATGLRFQKTLVYQPVAEVPLVSGDTAWYQPWSRPRFIKRTIYDQGAIGAPFTPPTETITEDKWHQAWSQPVRVKPRVCSQQDLAWSGLTPPAPATVSGVTTRTPQVNFPRSFIYQSIAWTPYPIIPEIITEDKWHQPWSQPVRVKPKVCFQQYLAWAPQTIVQSVVTFFQYIEGDTGLTFEKTLIYQQVAQADTPETHIFWDHPWNEPVLRKWNAGLVQTVGETLVPIIPESITEDKWHQAWSQPVRVKRKVAFQQDLIWSGFTPPPPAVPAVSTVTRTSQVSFPRSFIYQSRAWTPQTITLETITEDKWHQAWSEPVRFRRLATAQQQSLVWSGFTPAPEIITEDKWHFAWSEPVRFRRLVTAQQRSHFGPEATIPTPTAIEPATVTSQVSFPRSIIYQSVAWSPYPITVEVIYEDKWHQPWSIPVRKKPGLGTWEQRDLFWSGFTPLITEDRWHEPWSEPVRLKRGLRANLQQAFTAAPVYPNLQNIIPWYAPLAEPVRQKKGLGARLQQSFTAGTEPIATVITIILDATEVNRDVAAFFAVVYNPPVRCYVSIKEVPGSDPTYASIEEI